MDFTPFLLESDIKELKNDLTIVGGIVNFEKKSVNDCELSEMLSASEASICECEDGTVDIAYARELSSNGGRRKAELIGKFSFKDNSFNGSLRVRGRDMTDGSIYIDWNKNCVDIEIQEPNKNNFANGIKKEEEKLLQEISLFNEIVSESCAKNLRRLLPVTKTKIDWEKHALQPRIPEKSQ